MKRKPVDTYELPLYVKSGFSWPWRTFYLVFMFLFFFLIGFCFLCDTEDMVLFWVGTGFSAFTVLSLFCWLYIDILHKGYLEITDEYIRHRLWGKAKTVQWEEILRIEYFGMYWVERLSILDKAYTSSHRYEKHPLKFYAISITQTVFGRLEWKRLKRTIQQKLAETKGTAP